MSDDVDGAKAVACAETMSLARKIFVQMFGEEQVLEVRGLSVVRSPQNYPQCFKATNTIFLTTEAICDTIEAFYEFSHELCHLMIPGDVSPRFKWFEEVLCQGASVNALRIVSEKNKSSNPNAAVAINSFLARIVGSYEKIPKETPISAYIRNNLPINERYPARRNVNGAVAEAISSVFVQDFWKQIRKLCLLEECISFNDAMSMFSEELPDNLRSCFLRMVCDVSQ